MAAILTVKNLVTRFYTRDGTVHAVNGVGFHVDEGETLGVVGESGCGKSVSMLSILRLIPQPPGKVEAGQATFLGRDLLQLSPEEMRSVRGSQIAMVFQDALTALNPVLTVGQQLLEPLQLHLSLDRATARVRTVELLDQVGIPNARMRLDDYPHQLSGGMRQRVMIAMALACSPQILIADEPTTALDVTIQAQIIELVKRLRQELGMAIIWITHDLGIVAGIAHRVQVMYAGFVVERAAVKELYGRPTHPYTQGLLGSLPRIDERDGQPLANIRGLPPDLLTPPTRCPFAPRCTHTYDRCRSENPPLQEVGPAHEVACWWDVEKGGPRYDR